MIPLYMPRTVKLSRLSARQSRQSRQSRQLGVYQSRPTVFKGARCTNICYMIDSKARSPSSPTCMEGGLTLRRSRQSPTAVPDSPPCAECGSLYFIAEITLFGYTTVCVFMLLSVMIIFHRMCFVAVVTYRLAPPTSRPTIACHRTPARAGRAPLLQGSSSNVRMRLAELF